MGNKYTNNYEPKEKFDNISNYQYKPKDFYKLMKKINILDEIKRFHIKLDKDPNFDKNIKDFFYKKYGPFLNINRFIIPIIGVINSGKSTFMNNLLNLQNILQIGDTITTRFAAIIRHDKNANIPEIYNVDIERRSDSGFNFKEKGENLLKKNQNISKIIEELNKDIEKNQNINSEKYLYEPEKYFLIIRTRIHFFEGVYEDYGNLIDFLDIPGLDEINNENSCIFDDYIQMIFSNILFPIFIFDIKSFENDNAKGIFTKFLDLYMKNIMNFHFKVDEIYNKGFFLLNKIDLLNEDKEEVFKKFLEDYSKPTLSNGKDLEIYIEKEINFFGISAIKLSLKEKNNFIDNILEDIISDSKKATVPSFKKFIKKQLLEKYKIDLNKANEEDFNLKERLDIINNILKTKINNLNNPQFSLKEFTYLSKIKSENNSAFENINKNLIFQIQKKIKKELDEFLNFDFEGIIPFDLTELNKKKNAILKNKILNNDKFIEIINKEARNLFPDNINKKYKNQKKL